MGDYNIFMYPVLKLPVFQEQKDPGMTSFLYDFSLKKYECPAILDLAEELGRLPAFFNADDIIADAATSTVSGITECLKKYWKILGTILNFICRRIQKKNIRS